MFDGFWHGIFGGLFGPAIAQWLRRFKYWVVFLMTIVAVHVISFTQDYWEFGTTTAISKAIDLLSKPVGILAPMGIGLLAVLVAFIGSLNAPKKPSGDDKNNQ